MSECSNGLWVLPKGVDIRSFAVASEIEMPFIAPRYVIEDVEPDSAFQHITCRAAKRRVFDVSANVDELLESWRIHESWHTWAEFHGENECIDTGDASSEFLSLLSSEQIVREKLRLRRIKPYFSEGKGK